MTKQFTTDEIAEIIEREGLGYTISDYMTGESIADPELADKWNECKALMFEIQQIVSPGCIQSLEEPVSLYGDDEDNEEEEEDEDDEYDFYEDE